jgi:poly-gamma-glutamate system protein
MKTLYYRPKKVSKSVLLSLAGLSLLVMALVEFFPAQKLDGMESVKLEAAKRAEKAMEAVGQRRTELNHVWLEQLDPGKTMLIGPTMSSVTTQVGHLDAKQTSVNPNFAAVVVDLLNQAGAKSGDRVAIGCTGSFPALDIATYTAAEAMGLRPTIISSATSSQYGANHPELMWPDMEKLLFEKGLIQSRSIATSIGGVGDRGVGMTEDVLEQLLEAIDRNGVPLLRKDSLAEAVAERMRLYDEAAGDEDYVAYINVGGGSASVRGTKGNAVLGDGIVFPNAVDLSGVKECAAREFLQRGVPVINLINAINLAETYGLAVAPVTKVPVGEGQVYGRTVYRKSWAVAGILLILTAAWLIMHPVPAIEKWFGGKDAQPTGQLMV